MGFAPVAWVFVSLTACLGIGAAFMGPSIQAAVSDVIGTRRSGGQVLAVYQMCSDFGMILGPLVAGLIADAWGFVPAFVYERFVAGGGGLHVGSVPEGPLAEGYCGRRLHGPLKAL